VLAADATGAMAAVRLKAAKAARTRFFIEVSPFPVGRDVRLRWMDRWTYADKMIIGIRDIGFMRKMMKSEISRHPGGSGSRCQNFNVTRCWRDR
jgi:hypothetical protein